MLHVKQQVWCCKHGGQIEVTAPILSEHRVLLCVHHTLTLPHRLAAVSSSPCPPTQEADGGKFCRPLEGLIPVLIHVESGQGERQKKHELTPCVLHTEKSEEGEVEDDEGQEHAPHQHRPEEALPLVLGEKDVEHLVLEHHKAKCEIQRCKGQDDGVDHGVDCAESVDEQLEVGGHSRESAPSTCATAVPYHALP